MSDPNSQLLNGGKKRWYEGITRYEWIVLIIASAGWIFDVYEGQIFNLTRPAPWAPRLAQSIWTSQRPWGIPL